jgi:signal transduction histidine kinase
MVFIDNSIKFSPMNSTVSVTAKRIHDTVKVSFEDEGVGIPTIEQERIFDRFYQVDTARSKRSVGGYGLGLSVAKRIVNQLNGKISVESEVGKGTTFVVELPLAG